MRIINVTRGTTVCSSAIVARDPASRLAGLMFRGRLPIGSAMVLEPCNGIHTCFMRFPLDVAFVSRDWTVVRIEQAVPPWRFIPWVRGASRVVELHAGALAESLTVPGDVLYPMDP